MVTLARAHGDDSDWLPPGRCAIEVIADTLRGRPEKLAAMTFLLAVWLRHREHCTATKP